MSTVGDVVANSLNVTYDSGFSLPLVSASPYYKFMLGFPELPDPAEYCRQLVRLYEKHPYYDDVFSPLDGLAFLAKNGGWHVGMNTAVNRRFVIQEDGQVGVYYQCPALCLPWIHIDEIASMDAHELEERFLVFAKTYLQWEKNAYCCACRWRTVCGGLDVFCDLPAIATKQLDSMCVHRMLFLEHFASRRAPSHVVGTSE